MRRPSSRRDAIIREMGLGPVWRLRSAGGEADDQSTAVAEMPSPAAPPVDAAANPPSAPMRSAPAGGDAAWHRERAPRTEIAHSGSATRAEPVRPAAGMPDPGRLERIAALEWDALEADIRNCRACVLCEQRKQAVPGVGDREADWMLVGEGPGREEDQRGEPFVGQAGRLLDNMLAALALQRGANVYIANAVKCRPPHNRTPEAAEIGSCLPYLERQIELVKPRLLLALGRPAAQALLNTEISISRARGRIFDYKGIPVVVSYHPAYLLRNPQDKGKAWADLCFARKVMQQGG
ncbi:uracil-DNA glycosylase [Thauera sp. SDU_THAU2]|uniref:uracil-DNA glycosylase n=1 Tax=Thauera sp. SDU_THAU2 TaxID=3136633 RepID=UPI00311E0C1C